YLPELHRKIINSKGGQSSDLIQNILELYFVVVEKKANYSGCINIVKNYIQDNSIKQLDSPQEGNGVRFSKCFGSNITEEELNKVSHEYTHNYYNLKESANKRIYKMENAGIWTDEDKEKFSEGLRLYGH